MLAAAARCLRVLPRSRLPISQPALAPRARALPVCKFAARTVSNAAMDGSDAEAKVHAAAAAAGKEDAPAPAAAKPRARKTPAAKEKLPGAEGLTEEEKAEEKAQKKAKADAEKTVLQRSETPRKPPPAGCVRCSRPALRGLRMLGSRRASRPQQPPLTTRAVRRPAFKAVCWNVAGLRAVLNNGTGAVLQRLVADEAPDVICLQARASYAARSRHTPRCSDAASHRARRSTSCS